MQGKYRIFSGQSSPPPEPDPSPEGVSFGAADDLPARHTADFPPCFMGVLPADTTDFRILGKNKGVGRQSARNRFLSICRACITLSLSVRTIPCPTDPVPQPPVLASPAQPKHRLLHRLIRDGTQLACC